MKQLTKKQKIKFCLDYLTTKDKEFLCVAMGHGCYSPKVGVEIFRELFEPLIDLKIVTNDRPYIEGGVFETISARRKHVEKTLEQLLNN